MTFTITQIPDSVDLYLYPNADITVGLTRSEGATNYGCVNEAWSSPSEGDYVYTTDVTADYDYYGLPNHTTESGIINYVTVISYAKSNQYGQNSSGTYKIGIKDAIHTSYKSWGDNEAPITSSYDKYYYNFTSTPSGAAWTWASVDNLQLIIQCSSPVTTNTYDFISYPTSRGDALACTLVGETEHWRAVQDENDSSYVFATGTTGCNELHAALNHTTETGTINSLTFWFRCKSSNGTDGRIGYYFKSPDAGGIGRTHHSLTNVTPSTEESGWLWKSLATATNPSDGAAFSWTDIDEMQIGFTLDDTTPGCNTLVSEFYVDVNYTVATSPEIRTSQIYAVVNYTPSTTTVTLNQPESLSVSHGRNIERFMFPAGDYEVIDTGRASKTLQLTGYEIASSASTTMESLKDFCHYGSYVSIAGLPDPYLNTDYYITNFSFENVFNSAMPKYKWQLSLEQA